MWQVSGFTGRTDSLPLFIETVCPITIRSLELLYTLSCEKKNWEKHKWYLGFMILDFTNDENVQSQHKTLPLHTLIYTLFISAAKSYWHINTATYQCWFLSCGQVLIYCWQVNMKCVKDVKTHIGPECLFIKSLQPSPLSWCSDDLFVDVCVGSLDGSLVPVHSLYRSNHNWPYLKLCMHSEDEITKLHRYSDLVITDLSTIQKLHKKSSNQRFV